MKVAGIGVGEHDGKLRRFGVEEDGIGLEKEAVPIPTHGFVAEDFFHVGTVVVVFQDGNYGGVLHRLVAEDAVLNAVVFQGFGENVGLDGDGRFHGQEGGGGVEDEIHAKARRRVQVFPLEDGGAVGDFGAKGAAGNELAPACRLAARGGDRGQFQLKGPGQVADGAVVAVFVFLKFHEVAAHGAGV